MKAPTMPCFGGDDMSTLFITSLSHNHTPQDFEDYPLSGAVIAIKTNRQGVTIPAFQQPIGTYQMTAQYACLNNKHILITGGGSGIGEALVQAFHEQKAVVSFIDIDEKSSLALQSKLNNQVHFYKCDLRDVTALQSHHQTD